MMAKKKGLWANIHAKRKRGEAPAKKGEKGYPKTLDIMKEGGKSKKANTYEEHLSLSKKGWGHNKKAEKGGMLKGKSHAQGGIPIEVEGGEYIIKKKSVNKSTEPYLEYINNHGKLPPSFDARKRKGKK
jgi:hypothetical protein